MLISTCLPTGRSTLGFLIVLQIKDVLARYAFRIDVLSLELIISRAIKKKREFVLTHPEYKLSEYQVSRIKHCVSRLRRAEPLAYVLGEKEFYGLNFKINKKVLIPRPETELLVEMAIRNLRKKIRAVKKKVIVDIGTGSGNIIISLAKELKKLKLPIDNYQFLAIDISQKALVVAKQNAQLHKIHKIIKFFSGNLITPVINNKKFLTPNTKCLILANLPYLSSKIYESTAASVRNYEPKKALLSHKGGLWHYQELFKQIIKLTYTTNHKLSFALFFEFSPEQKNKISKLIKNYFPTSKIKFYKDLANKWRACQLEIN